MTFYELRDFIAFRGLRLLEYKTQKKIAIQRSNKILNVCFAKKSLLTYFNTLDKVDISTESLITYFPQENNLITLLHFKFISAASLRFSVSHSHPTNKYSLL
jgi:hypothetical protein